MDKRTKIRGNKKFVTRNTHLVLQTCKESKEKGEDKRGNNDRYEERLERSW